MKLVVGLGNPGRKYVGTRHNVGYEIVARVAQRYGVTKPKAKFQGEIVEINVEGHRGILLCPQTYMNLSGVSVRLAVDFYRIVEQDLLVVCDDFNLPLGRLRFRASGSAGGQKGLTDIIQKMNSDRFSRLRMGIGACPENWDTTGFVLGRFDKVDRDEMDIATQEASCGVVDWIQHDIDYCMNQYNGK